MAVKIVLCLKDYIFKLGLPRQLGIILNSIGEKNENTQ